jgi:hypothetical protein
MKAANGFPYFTDEQVAALEDLFPARCLRQNETVEDHLRYAGKVELIASMRGAVIGGPKALVLSEEEEDAIDDAVIEIAVQQQSNGET